VPDTIFRYVFAVRLAAPDCAGDPDRRHFSARDRAVGTQRRIVNNLVECAAAQHGHLETQISMSFLMNLCSHLQVVAALLIGGWMVHTHQLEVGGVVAFISGVGRMNDPWRRSRELFQGFQCFPGKVPPARRHREPDL
jgi:ABC-type multidrug transport system fused ATPase/permease subunit